MFIHRSLFPAAVLSSPEEQAGQLNYPLPKFIHAVLYNLPTYPRYRAPLHVNRDALDVRDRPLSTVRMVRGAQARAAPACRRRAGGRNRSQQNRHPRER